jgi:hypothetical protein
MKDVDSFYEAGNLELCQSNYRNCLNEARADLIDSQEMARGAEGRKLNGSANTCQNYRGSIKVIDEPKNGKENDAKALSALNGSRVDVAHHGDDLVQSNNKNPVTNDKNSAKISVQQYRLLGTVEQLVSNHLQQSPQVVYLSLGGKVLNSSPEINGLVKALTIDLAAAVRVDAARIKITDVDTQNLVVSILILPNSASAQAISPCEIANSLATQAEDPTSVLRRGPASAAITRVSTNSPPRKPARSAPPAPTKGPAAGSRAGAEHQDPARAAVQSHGASSHRLCRILACVLALTAAASVAGYYGLPVPSPMPTDSLAPPPGPAEPTQSAAGPPAAAPQPHAGDIAAGLGEQERGAEPAAASPAAIPAAPGPEAPAPASPPVAAAEAAPRLPAPPSPGPAVAAPSAPPPSEAAGDSDSQSGAARVARVSAAAAGRARGDAGGGAAAAAAAALEEGVLAGVRRCLAATVYPGRRTPAESESSGASHGPPAAGPRAGDDNADGVAPAGAAACSAMEVRGLTAAAAALDRARREDAAAAAAAEAEALALYRQFRRGGGWAAAAAAAMATL